MANKYTIPAEEALNRAKEFASEFTSGYTGSEHLLLGLLAAESSAAAQILYQRGLRFDLLKSEIEKSNNNIRGSTTLEYSPRVIKILKAAETSAESSEIGTEHILLAILGEAGCTAVRIMNSLGIAVQDVFSDVVSLTDEAVINSKEPADQSSGDQNQALLKKYGRDLTEAAKKGLLDPVIGRDEETERVINILLRRVKNNPCLIGEPGVGKTAVVEGLAQRIADREVPDALLNKSIVSVDVSSMVSGAKYRGEFEERIKGVIEGIKKSNNIILFIDEIHTIIGAGAAEGAVDAASILKPELSRSGFQLIGATTTDEYRKRIEKDAALERRFQTVNIPEPSCEDTVRIIKGIRNKYEKHHNVKITDEAIEAAVYFSDRYIRDRYLPDKAIDLIDEAASRANTEKKTASKYNSEEKYSDFDIQKEKAINSGDLAAAALLKALKPAVSEKYKKSGKNSRKHDIPQVIIKREDIEKLITQRTGIPVSSLNESEEEKLIGLASRLKMRVIGQDEAAEALARAVKRGRTGLKAAGRIQGAFIFLGPTGVGKTELAKALAAELYPDKNAFIRIDMSEFMEKHSVSKLIGSPPGYIGYDEGGRLTEKVRRNPYSLILFDEIEKAHPDVYDLLLQVIDDGILTDSQGRTVDFKNSIIIMTSNVGAAYASSAPKRTGFTVDNAVQAEDRKERYLSELKRIFKPEFINRLDDVIVFNSLDSADIKKIAYLMLSELAGRLQSLGYTVEFEDSLVSLVSKEGYDPQYGARPLRRLIQKKVEDSFVELILEGMKSPSKVRAYADNNEVKYEKLSSVI